MSGSFFSISKWLGWTRRVLGNDHLVLAVLAVVVGVLGGGSVIIFREGISLFQNVAFGTPSERLYHHLLTLPAWQIVLAPTLGGLVVGVLVRLGMSSGRPEGMADVIEASALKGGDMSVKTGLRAAVISAVSIGAGASVGREGPAVHLGASLGSWIGKRLHLTRNLRRTALACGAAAAVAASFNAPIAGALFAGEVIIGHYALKSFAPVVIASVAGTAVSRAYYGAFPAFALHGDILISWWQFPAYVMLGLLAGGVAVLLIRGVFWSAAFIERTNVPQIFRPAMGGFVLGLMALVFPQVLGVGYGVNEQVLLGAFSLGVLLLLLVAKIAATSISLGVGFGGGVFSPSLVIGALLGAAFGGVANMLFPGSVLAGGAYAVVGMGAVAAAVLGAPISTALIVFEMTADYELTMAVMVGVVVSSAVVAQTTGKSFFSAQLDRRGHNLKDGYAIDLLRSRNLSDLVENIVEVVGPECRMQKVRTSLQQSRYGELFVVNSEGILVGTITLADLSEMAFDANMDNLINAQDVARLRPPMLNRTDDLHTAMRLFNDTGENCIAVVDGVETKRFMGCVFERRVFSAYSQALLESRHEEQRGW